MEIIRNHEDVTLVLQMPCEKVFDVFGHIWTPKINSKSRRMSKVSGAVKS